MRSLILSNEYGCGLGDHEFKLMTTNPLTRTTYLLKYEDSEAAVYVIEDKDSLEGLVELINFPLEGSESIISFEFLSDSDSLLLASDFGNIYSLNLDINEVETIGTIDDGIQNLTLSPDEELLVIVNPVNLIIMNKDFHVLSETSISNQQSIENPVTVGWGKKETQFHGSLGKQAAQANTTVQVELAAGDDLLPQVSFRGDGNYFCISSVEPGKGRGLKVYDRQGNLLNLSEPVSNLENTLNWRPSGNWIAASCRSHKYQVLFYERNGLRHGEFTLPADVDRVRKLKFNSDSTVLAVVVSKNNVDYVQLWTVNNYFWYLKSELEVGTFVDLEFDSETPLNLKVLSKSAIHFYRFHQDRIASTLPTIDNASCVGVINGTQLLLTPFKFRNVPPPMAAFTLQFKGVVQAATFANFGTGNAVVVVTNKSTLEVAKMHIDGRKLSCNVTSTTDIDTNVRNRHLVYQAENLVFGLGHDLVANCDVVTRYDLDTKSTIVYPLTGRFIHMAANPILGKLPILQDMDGQLFQLHFNNDELSTIPLCISFSEPCPSMTVVHGTETDLVLGLNTRNRLYLNDQLIDDRVTSYFLHDAYLIVTTSDHVSKFIAYQDLLANKFDNDRNDGTWSRVVERGARIVTSHFYGEALILQMPRGNLETVYPRALVLEAVGQQLSQSQFGNALVSCRKHRVDMNILYDFNPENFLEHITDFVAQVKEVDHLNLFLTSLRDSLLLFDSKKLTDQDLINRSKVNLICDKLNQTLTQLDSQKYLQPIITTLACQSPPKLEEILVTIKQFDSQPDLVDSSIKYATLLVPVDQLYNAALGLYDFKLVLQVAQHSQKDPKEYVAFLRKLEKLELHRRRFEIDNHLKRFSNALTHMPHADFKFEEVLEFIKLHTLYTDAIPIYRGTEEFKPIVEAYATYLLSNKMYLDAGLAFDQVQSYKLAIPAYVQSCNWQKALINANHLHYDQEQTLELVNDLIACLKNHSRYLEAAKLIETYKKDVEEVSSCLLEGHHWNDALLICTLNDRSDLIETDVLSKLDLVVEQVNEDVQDMIDQFTKQNFRLHEMRTKPKFSLPDDPNLENIDVMSEATTTNFTVYTKQSTVASTSNSYGSNKTGKSKRKMERKRNSGRKGSAFEEEYLLGSISRLVTRTNNIQNEVKRLVPVLYTFNQRKTTAKKLAQKLEELVNLLEKNLDSIYDYKKELSIAELNGFVNQPQNTGDNSNQQEKIEKPKLEKVSYQLILLTNSHIL